MPNYDYSQSGYYFVTMHTEYNQHILSSIVGRGLAPAYKPISVSDYEHVSAEIKLTDIGHIAEQQLFALEKRFECVKIDKYVIMPNHIHVIIIINPPICEAGASSRPTLSNIIGAYKSITTRLCNRNENIEGRKIFQTSFYDSIIRNEKMYYSILNYIETNPLKWIINNII